MYESGIPSNLIVIIRMGLRNTRLRPRNNGKIGGGTGNNNKGVFRGIPLSAYLFIIYDGSMMGYYGNSLKQETGDNTNSIK